MKSEAQDILLKLDLPEGEQTYLGARIDFKFWIADPTQDRPIRKEKFEYDILCQEVKPTSSSSYMGTMKELVLFSSDSSIHGFPSLRVEEIEFKEGNTYHSLDGQISSPVLEVTGCIKRDLSLRGTFVIKIRARIKGLFITSNSNSLTLSSREDFAGRILGGPTRMIPERYFGRAIILRGWAFLLGSEIESVEAIIPLASSVFVKHGTDLKELEKSLPDLEEVRTAGIEVVAFFNSPLEGELVTVNVRVKFKSGELQDYYWGSTYIDTKIKSGFVLTKLEEEGRWVRVEGNLFSSRAKDVEFFLCSSRGIKKLSADYVSINQGEDSSGSIDSAYFCSNGFSNVSFLLPNDYLGSNPGSVSLNIKIDGNCINLIGSHIKGKFSVAFNSYPQRRKGSILSKAFRWFGGRGLLPVKSVQSDLPLTRNYQAKHIMFVSHNLSLTEGAPKVLYSIITGMSKSFSASLVSLREGEARSQLSSLVKSVFLIPELDQVGLDFCRFKVGSGKMNEILDKESPASVVANGLDSFPFVCASIDTNVPVIWIIHESIDPAHWYRNLPISIRNRFLFALNNADKIVFVSERTRELYLPFIENGSSTVIRNGIDLEKFGANLKAVDVEREKIKLQIGPEEFVFLSVGTITERKGQDRTIRELAILKKNNPEFKFKMFFVGAREIPFLWSMRQLVEKLDLAKEVVFISETSDVAKYFAVAHCFIVNSREESSPLVVLEAFAGGLPLVSTTVFGLADLVSDGENALIFDGDKEGQLAGVLFKIARESSLRERLSCGGVKFVRGKLSLDKMVREYNKLIEEVEDKHS